MGYIEHRSSFKGDGKGDLYWGLSKCMESKSSNVKNALVAFLISILRMQMVTCTAYMRTSILLM